MIISVITHYEGSPGRCPREPPCSAYVCRAPQQPSRLAGHRRTAQLTLMLSSAATVTTRSAPRLERVAENLKRRHSLEVDPDQYHNVSSGPHPPTTAIKRFRDCAPVGGASITPKTSTAPNLTVASRGLGATASTTTPDSDFASRIVLGTATRRVADPLLRARQPSITTSSARRPPPPNSCGPPAGHTAAEIFSPESSIDRALGDDPGCDASRESLT